MGTRLKAYGAVLGAVVFWGISFVATKTALTTISPYTLLVCRFAAASLLLFPVWWLGGRERLDAGDAVLFALLGLMEPGLYFLLETWGLVYTSASNASLIVASIPVFVALLAAVLLKEPLDSKAFSGILLTVCGVGVLVWHGSGVQEGGNVALGNLLVLGAAFCASAYTVVSRRLRSRYGTLTLTMIQFLFATLFFMPPAAREWWKGGGVFFTPEVLAAVLFLAFFATFCAFFLYNYCLGALEASRVAVFINLIPLVTVLTARVLLGESLSAFQASGGLLILGGVGLTTLCRGKGYCGGGKLAAGDGATA